MNVSQNIINTNQCKCLECSGKGCSVYGGFCKKHRKEYLLKDNLILLERFTNNSKDYQLQELKYSYTRYINPKKPTKFKKDDYFNQIVKVYTSSLSHKLKEPLIVKIQSHLRMKQLRNKVLKHGFAILNRSICKNDEDFYTYDPKEEIESKFFYSYKDSSNNHWCFDIRSIKKLIEMNYGNPYTIEPFPQIVQTQVSEFINKLTQSNQMESIETNMISDRKSIVKQRFVDLFSQIEYSGYSCSVDWILNLNPHKLHRFYKELEDIWNYRANLTPQVKKNIVYPDGRFLVMPVSDYLHIHSKLELQEILSSELIKICNARTPGDANLGFMYIIIALSIVSRPCFLIHPWVQFVF